MTQKQLVPKRRFEGFSDEWKVNSFNDLLDELEGIRRGPFGSALKKEYFVPHSNYVVYEQQNAIYDRYQTRYYITKQKYEELSRFSINEDDFIMSGAGTIGRISKVPKDIKKGVINQALIRIRVNKKIVDSNYFLQWMRSEDMQNKLTQANPASAMVNLVPMSEVKGWQIKVPSIEEQQEIGQFFKHLDEMIAQQQRKIDKTKALKSAYFVEMFPAEGESVPKRRFSGFTGEWEEYSLGELTKINTGGSDAQDAKENGAYPFFVRSEKIQRSDNYTFNGEAILIPGEGRLGEIYHHFIGKFDYHQRVYKISHFDEKLDGKFTFYTMHKTFKKHALKYTVKATVDSLRLPIITEYKLLLPTIKEQQKIGQFFKHLDEMIATHQQKLEKLKATKQAYLHEMFV